MTKEKAEFLENYETYLRDESRLVGDAEQILFPQTEKDVIKYLSNAKQKQQCITVQGGRTGLSGAASPSGGIILNMSRMNEVIGMRKDTRGKIFVNMQPGVLLSDFRKALLEKEFDTKNWDQQSIDVFHSIKKGQYFFSPDPTETSASIGGMVACNASGARSFLYGPMRRHVSKLRIVLADGDLLEIKRGQYFAKENSFCFTTDSGRKIQGKLPELNMPDVKSAAAYYCKPNMDLIDLFIGAEGTLGVITEVEVGLLPSPKYIWGVTAFMPDEYSALELVRLLRGEEVLKNQPKFALKPVSIEFFNADGLNLLRKQKQQNAAFSSLQDLEDRYHTAIYAEFHSNDIEQLEQSLISMGEGIDLLGGNQDDIWLGENEKNMEQLHLFRHAMPECVNLQIDKIKRHDESITKLGTDMSVPDAYLHQVMQLYNQSLKENQLDSVIFGHIGNNHLHVNIIPKNQNEYQRGKQLYLEWAKKIVHMGGSISAEHGIGKLKVEMLNQMYSPAVIHQMRELKLAFDPTQVLNRGNIFEYQKS